MLGTLRRPPSPPPHLFCRVVIVAELVALSAQLVAALLGLGHELESSCVVGKQYGDALVGAPPPVVDVAVLSRGRLKSSPFDHKLEREAFLRCRTCDGKTDHRLESTMQAEMK